MQVEVTVRHGTISDDVRTRLTEKAEKLLTFFERVTSIQVTVELEKPLSKNVEILVDAEHRHDFVATSRDDDVLAAFDQAFHKMEQQIKKYKERIQDHRRDLPINELVSSEDGSEEAEDGPDSGG